MGIGIITLCRHVDNKGQVALNRDGERVNDAEAAGRPSMLIQTVNDVGDGVLVDISARGNSYRGLRPVCVLKHDCDKRGRLRVKDVRVNNRRPWRNRDILQYFHNMACTVRIAHGIGDSQAKVEQVQLQLFADNRTIHRHAFTADGAPILFHEDFPKWKKLNFG